MPSYRLDIEYAGTRYRGWQEQPGVRTVAGELRRAVQDAAGPIVELGGAGRTDAGVHAAGQTAHLRLRAAVDAGVLRERVNDGLPADIHVLAAAPAPERFHARHDALGRSYVYQISRRRTALAKNFVWWVKRPLEAGRMAAAAARFAGRRDFALFTEAEPGAGSTVVEVAAVEVLECGDLILVRMHASHFLWKMVRRVVGTLVRVGAGELPEARFKALLEGRAGRAEEARVAAGTAPPSGLFLERVLYPGEAGLGPLAPVMGVGRP